MASLPWRASSRRPLMGKEAGRSSCRTEVQRSPQHRPTTPQAISSERSYHVFDPIMGDLPLRCGQVAQARFFGGQSRMDRKGRLSRGLSGDT